MCGRDMRDAGVGHAGCAGAGRYALPSQQHFYMETQVAVAEPREGGGMHVTASTQSIDLVQAAVARLLDIPSNMVTVGSFAKLPLLRRFNLKNK